MMPSEKPIISKEFVFIQNSPGASKGEIFLRKSDGSLVSMNAESHSKLKKERLDSLVIETMGLEGREYITLNLVEAKKKLGDDFPRISQVGKEKVYSAPKKAADLHAHLPEADRHLVKTFQKAVSQKAVELSQKTIEAKINHTYTAYKGDILLHVNERLGEGGFKTVKLAQSIFTEEYIVIGTIKSAMETKEQVKSLKNEYELHKQFQGIGFMKVYDFIVYKNKEASGRHAIHTFTHNFF